MGEKPNEFPGMEVDPPRAGTHNRAAPREGGGLWSMSSVDDPPGETSLELVSAAALSELVRTSSGCRQRGGGEAARVGPGRSRSDRNPDETLGGGRSGLFRFGGGCGATCLRSSQPRPSRWMPYWCPPLLRTARFPRRPVVFSALGLARSWPLICRRPARVSVWALSMADVLIRSADPFLLGGGCGGEVEFAGSTDRETAMLFRDGPGCCGVVGEESTQPDAVGIPRPRALCRKVPKARTHHHSAGAHGIRGNLNPFVRRSIFCTCGVVLCFAPRCVTSNGR